MSAQRDAIHEAGHAVAAILKGVPFEFVALLPYSKTVEDGGELFVLEARGGLPLDCGDLRRGLVPIDALSLLAAAGVAAERLCFGMAGLDAQAGDLAGLRHAARLAGARDFDTGEAFGAALRPAERLLAVNRAAVERVACDLEEARVLSRAQVKAAVLELGDLAGGSSARQRP